MPIIILCVFIRVSYGQVNFSGRASVWLVSDPQYFKPGGFADWNRKLWIGSNIYQSTPIVGWGNSRILLNATVGSQFEPYYVYFPLHFMNSIHYEKGLSELLIGMPDYIAVFRSRPFQISLASRRVGENNIWSYVSPNDPLGALKLPATSEPVMTVKLFGKLPGEWITTAYFISDYRSSFSPAREVIPSLAYSKLGTTREDMPYFDEIPMYKMIRTTKDFNENLKLGLLWGQKEATNIVPRDSKDGGYKALNSRVGYLKENLGFDLVGEFPFTKEATFTFASVFSSGNWRHFLKRDDYNVPVTCEDLGTLKGDALKFEISNLQIGEAIVEGAVHYVEPNFQWVAVRDTRYAYVYDFWDRKVPQFEAWGWRAVEDKDYLLRDQNRKAEYESDVATYLGVKSNRWKISIPGKLPIGIAKDTLLSFDFWDITNIGESIFYEPETFDEQLNSYQQYAANLSVNYYPNMTMTLYGKDKTYKKASIGNDYRQELGVNISSELDKRLVWEGELKSVWRLRSDDGQGKGQASQAKVLLSGMTDKNIRVESGIDYRVGNYEYGLLDSSKDKVLLNPYKYLRLFHYLEHNFRMQVGKTQVPTRAAIEINKINSTLFNLPSGMSLIGYVQGRVPISRSCTVTVTGAGVTGPQGESFSSSKLSSFLDSQLEYKLAGLNENVLRLRCTKRLNNITKTNWHIVLQSNLGKHSLSIAYGRSPAYEYNTYYIAGSLYDVRFNPDQELSGRPWRFWGDRSINADSTLENYFTLGWNILF